MPITIPTDNAIERKLASIDNHVELPDDLAGQEPDTVRSELTDLVLIPGIRFDGSSEAIPWNHPEGELFDWLTTVDVVLVDDIYTGVNGVFAARAVDDDDPRSLVVKFSNLGKDSLLSSWGTEFLLLNELDITGRELAAYELLKAIGLEDMAPPLCLRDIDPVLFLTDKARGNLSRALKISPLAVDEHIGTGAVLQMVPQEFDNFAEQWSMIGSTNEERWNRATDQLRYSIYRAYLADFVLGTPNRSCVSFGYNKNTDKLIMSDCGLSFPHSGFSAEKYSQMRLKGWGRSSGGAVRFVDNTPPSAYDFQDIMSGMSEDHLDECVMTAKQIVDRMQDDLSDRLAATLIEYDVPVQGVASVFLRLAYMAFAPGSVIKRPIEFLRNFCVPARAGVLAEDDRLITSMEHINELMTVALGDDFDTGLMLSEPLPDLAEMLV